ncbi:DUF6578 domain-containing protein [Leifsonia virtsii]|uniref:Uncharacterized protein n=1 Tax=Leifsonia virtsii TaxID=3035915 RepID=A0ABT8IXD1_9MICO|nr:DUF6578 domain-containing protein [Leifsonia virtsii]MDN4597485.1 hypothetical protein [Leifsonia virtsii]
MDATRTIEVLVSGMDYACCGVPFAVGDDIGFSLTGLPADPARPDAPQFADERHNVSDLPLVDVRGRVERIVAVHSRLVPVPGAHHRTSDPGDTVEREVDAVPVDDLPEGYSGADYRVRLRIPATAALPERPERRVDSPVAEEATPASSAPPPLTAVIDEVEARYADSVEILRGRGDASATIAPRRPGAVTVRWNAHCDTISVELERAVWRLSWDAAGVETVRDLVDAAEHGRFAERLEGGRLVARATLRDGRTLSTSSDVTPTPQFGFSMMTVSAHDRLTRARSAEPYPPWMGATSAVDFS